MIIIIIIVQTSTIIIFGIVFVVILKSPTGNYYYYTRVEVYGSVSFYIQRLNASYHRRLIGLALAT